MSAVVRQTNNLLHFSARPTKFPVGLCYLYPEPLMEPQGTMKNKFKNIDWLTVGILGGLIFMGILPILVYFGYLN